MADKIVMIDSPESAKRMTVDGWVSSSGHFFGENERAARWDGCTHTYCTECGAVIMKSGYTICDDCRQKKDIARYDAMPRVEWDGETPLYSESCDEYFFDSDNLRDYIEEHECTAESLRLIVCEADKYKELSDEYFYDCFSEDEELPIELLDAIEELNKVVRSLEPAAYSPGKYAASIKQEILK